MIILIVFISLSVLILIHELGHFGTAKFFKVRVDEFGLGFPPKIYSKKIGETVYSLNALPLGGFVKIPGEDGGAPPAEIKGNTFTDKSFLPKLIMLLGGIIMNIILGWFVLSVVFMVGSDAHLVISGVAKNSPAELSGIKMGDIISEVKFSDLIFEDPIKASDFSGIFKNFPGNPVDIKISRNQQILEMKVAGRVNPPVGEGALGVTLAEIGFPQKSFFQSFGSGFMTTLQILKDIFIGFYDLITRSFREPEILSSVSGPIGIFMLARETSVFGFIYLLQLMALISLNLAVLNLIPFPALDGGRVLILIIEQFKRKPISQKFQMIYNAVGFLTLIGLMIIVSIKDIRALF